MPGFDGTGQLFAPLLAALPSHWRPDVLRYDRERTLDDYVQTLIRRLAADKAVLIAESFSGPIALAVMSRHPDRVRAAVLCATFARTPFRPLTRLARFMPSAAFAFHAGQATLLKHYCLDASCASALEERMLAIARAMSPATVKHRLELLAGLEASELRSRTDVPTLLLRATGDRLVSVREHRELCELLPHAIVGEVEGPHMLLQARATECAALIVGWLDSLDTQSTLQQR